MPQNATEIEDVRARAWGMYLGGMSKSRIAAALSLDRETVSRYIKACYAEIAAERRMTMARKLDMAVARMRHVGVQAWAALDADDGGHRSQYLRVILEVEKAIARLEGPYEMALDDDGGGVTVTFVKLTEAEVQRRVRERAQGGQIAAVAAVEAR